MRISYRLLLILAKVARDREAEKALQSYHGLTNLADKNYTIRVWVVGESYQVGLTRR